MSATSTPPAAVRTIRITGMTCAACERRVTRALSALPGVESATASARRGRAVLVGAASPEEVAAAVARAGYTVGAPPWLTRDRRAWWTAGVTAAVLAAAAVAWAAGGLSVPAPPDGAAGPVLGLLVGLAAGVSTCMALVGGLVLGVSANATADAGSAGRLRPQVLFQTGRITAFAVGGALLGTLGTAADLPGGVLTAATGVAAAVMLLLGVRLTGLSPRIAGWTPSLPASWTARVPLGGDRGAAALGALTFLLPCGFTQAMQVYAVSLGSPAAGAAVMAAFAVGTLPGLLGLGVLGGRAAAGIGRASVAVGVVVVAFALLTGTGVARSAGLAPDLPDARPTQLSAGVRLLDGVQDVPLTITAHGYEPARVVVAAGVPIRWRIEVTGGYSCATALRVPAAGVSVDVPRPGSYVVDVPALRPGTTRFHCAMGMYTGSFVAIDPPAAG